MIPPPPPSIGQRQATTAPFLPLILITSLDSPNFLLFLKGTYWTNKS
jgi:hypothetical protein